MSKEMQNIKSANDGNETNSYLLLREAKIARNKERLERLGLAKQIEPVAFPLRENVASTDKKEVKSKGKEDGSEWKPVVGTRRSSRIRNGTNMKGTLDESSSKSENFGEKIGNLQLTKRRRTNSEKNSKTPPKEAATSTAKTKVVIQSEAKPGTTRATIINVKQTLNGNFDYPIFVGRRLAATGKAAVVEHANFMSGNPLGISFNKYSGVCEFRNSALFLWVNMNTPDADVRNEFLNEGKQITWFGGSRMHDHTPVIQKLMSVGQMASKGQLLDSDGIVLWYRMYDEKRKFGAYICLGRLGFHTHVAGSHPVKIIWNLLDYEILKHASETDGDCLFEEIMKRNL